MNLRDRLAQLDKWHLDKESSLYKSEYLDEELREILPPEIRLNIVSYFKCWLDSRDIANLDIATIILLQNGLSIPAVFAQELINTAQARLTNSKKIVKPFKDSAHRKAFITILQLQFFCEKSKVEAVELACSCLADYQPDFQLKASSLEKGYDKWAVTNKDLLMSSWSKQNIKWDSAMKEEFLRQFPKELRAVLKGERR